MHVATKVMRMMNSIKIKRQIDDSSGNGSDESDSDEFEWHAQGNNRSQVHQYCDELQTDEQENALNHGLPNTQRKSRTRKPDNRKRPNERISWDDRIQDLKAFKETFGHCRVKQKFENNPALGRFVNKMRDYKNIIKRGILSKGRFLTPARINRWKSWGLSGISNHHLSSELSN